MNGNHETKKIMCDVILSQAAPLLAAVSRFVRHSPGIQQGWDPDSRAPVRDSARALLNASKIVGFCANASPLQRYSPQLTEAPGRRPGNDADRHRLPDALLDDRLPRHQGEAFTVLQHGVATAGQHHGTTINSACPAVVSDRLIRQGGSCHHHPCSIGRGAHRLVGISTQRPLGAGGAGRSGRG